MECIGWTLTDETFSSKYKSILESKLLTCQDQTLLKAISPDTTRLGHAYLHSHATTCQFHCGPEVSESSTSQRILRVSEKSQLKGIQHEVPSYQICSFCPSGLRALEFLWCTEYTRLIVYSFSRWTRRLVSTPLVARSNEPNMQRPKPGVARSLFSR